MPEGGPIVWLICSLLAIIIIVLAVGGFSHAVLTTPMFADGSQQFDGGFTRSILVLFDGGFHFLMGLIGVSISG